MGRLTDPEAPYPRPYGDAAPAYWAAGWRGVIPLPANEKGPPPDGYTGAAGVFPSYADVAAWCEDLPHANIGIRLPGDVIGIDVDSYDGKQGGHTLLAAIRKWGALPETWWASARTPGTGSGIHLYRVPEGLRWPGQVGPDVEIIQFRHRYMVAPPSRHPSTGRIYQWYGPDGPLPVTGPPSPGDLPYLPDAWVHGLTAGVAELEFHKGEASQADVQAFVERSSSRARPCRIMMARLDRLLGDLVTGGSRHDTALRGIMAFAHLAAEGHTGFAWAQYDLHNAWMAAVTAGPGARSQDQAAAEWGRMVAGAVGWSLVNAPGELPDPCDDLAAILGPEGATLPAPDNTDRSRQGDTRPPPNATLRPIEQQGDAGQNVPPAWVTDQLGDHAGQTEDGADLPPVDAIPAAGSADSRDAAEGSTWDRHAVAVALEVERLEVRRDARLALAHAEHLRTWRQPPFYTLREALALPDIPPQWRVCDVMPEGANVLLTAQFKTGKTTLINELTKAVVDGHEFLGVFKVPHAVNVALFNYEVGESQYVHWLRDRGITAVDAVHLFNLRGFSLPLGVPLVREFIIGWLRERGIGMWIVDPFARAFSGAGDENNNADVSPFLEILDEIKERAGVTELVMPTHTGRSEFAIGAERARGATRLDDWADVRWLLTRGTGDDEGTRYFRATGRDVEVEEGRLEFDPVTRALTLGEGSRPRNAGRGGSGRQNAAQSAADMVLEVVGDVPGISHRQMRIEARQRGLQVNNVTLAEAARRLAQQGRIRVERTRLANGNHSEAHYLVGGDDE